MSHLPKATPDSFVGIAPVNWGLDNIDLLAETHGLNWMEEISIELEPVTNQPTNPLADDDEAGVIAHGTITFEDDVKISLVVEEPLPDLHTLAGTSKEVYTTSEVILLKEHIAAWRFTVAGGAERNPRAARRFGRLASTFVEAGAAGIFMPGIVTLHSPRFIKFITMDLTQIENIANLCIYAWHTETWMMTRGLTAFGLPELETPIDEGMNAAYFRLMDVATSMLTQRHAFPNASKVTLNSETYKLLDGHKGPRDKQIPFSGAFGVQTVELAY